MIRVVHHSKTVGYAGTDKTAQVFCAELNKLPGFEAFLVYRADDTSRLAEAQEMIGHDRVVLYHHVHQKNPPAPYLPESDNLRQVLEFIKPDIFHVHRSGYQEWPGMRHLAPSAKFVETNIFGYHDASGVIDWRMYISDFIADRAGRHEPYSVLYNPTLPPFFEREEARPEWFARLGLTGQNDAVLLGRVGRPDNFTPIALRALSVVQRTHPHVHYLVVNGCDAWRDGVKKYRLNNVHFVDPIISDRELSRFYAALDIYAHARCDGECQPCNLNEAMYHGLPVVTHMGHTYQGQVEQVNAAQGNGWVARDWRDYASMLENLVVDADKRRRIGEANRRWASTTVDATVVTKRLAAVYEELINV